jgi:hypothetical protein
VAGEWFYKTTSRLRWLNQEEIDNILRAGPVQFVVADIGLERHSHFRIDYLDIRQL